MSENKTKWYLCFAAGVSVLGGGAQEVLADISIDTAPAWPLCGRITEAPPSGWQTGDDCPAARFGNPSYSDFPLNSTFGPRILPTTGYRLDYHQGIDISVPTGTPVFAIARGEVTDAGPKSGYEDPMIRVRHYDSDAWGSCSRSEGCAHSVYMHLSGWVVNPGQTVQKGQLIGFTGASESGYEHLHFEIKQAPVWDSSSAWNRDSIHPLQVLPYHRDIADTSVYIDDVDVTDPLNPVIELRAVQPVGAKTWDLKRVEVDIYDKRTGVRISQTGDTLVAGEYHLFPSFYDMVTRNQEYAHKDSSVFPWESFVDCPFAGDHGNGYDSGVHIEATHPSDPLEQVGHFNGITSEISRYVFDDEDYELRLVFEELQGVPSAQYMCIKAKAINAKGERSRVASWNCK